MLAEGLRRGLIEGEIAEADGPNGPGMLLLDATDRVESATPAAWRWLEELPGLPTGGTRLPWVVLAVAKRVREPVSLPDVGETGAHARVLAR